MALVAILGVEIEPSKILVAVMALFEIWLPVTWPTRSTVGTEAVKDPLL